MNATSSYEAVERAQRAVEQWKEVLEFATANLERAHRNLEAARRIGTQPALPQPGGDKAAPARFENRARRS